MPDIQSAGLRGRILTEIDGKEYDLANVRAIAAIIKKPLYHFLPADADDVSRAVIWAAENGVKFSVKCGGQNPAGVSAIEGGLLIDMRSINHVVLEGDQVRIGGGCIFDEIYKGLHEHGRVIAGGGVWVVGAGGYLTNGGYSWLSSLYGMGVDQVKAATVVLADGRIVKCDANTEADLFWAIRGGASQFGVVTEFVLKTYPEPEEIFCGTLIYPNAQFDNLLQQVKSFMNTRTDEESLVFGIMQDRHNLKGQALMLNTFGIGSRPRIENAFRPFIQDLKPFVNTCAYKPSFVELSHAVDDILLGKKPARMASSSAAFTTLWEGMVEDCHAAQQAFLENHSGYSETMMLFEMHATKRPDAATTAYSCDVPNHSYVVITTGYEEKEGDAVATDFVNSIASIIRKHEEKNTGRDLGLLSNGCMGELPPSDLFKQNYPRLQRIKAKYDPNRVFDLFPSIIPDANAA